ncbi:MAG: alpha/beta hydrolase domain-containing protein, partial [Alphaproteobacteria bacterium]
MSGNGIKEIVITETQSPVYDGRVFGDVGAYERLSGYVIGAVDPADPRNAGIVNLDKAPRNSDGLVEYKSDLCILRPVDAAKNNGWLFHEILNRGSKRVISRANSGPAINTMEAPEDAGTGFLMNEGYTMVWTGWQDDIDRDEGRMCADYPIAADATGPITGRCLEEFINEAQDDVFTGALSYPAATLAQSDATLSVRGLERDKRETPTGLSWRYLDDRRIEITRPDGFDGGAIFEFIYTAKDPSVCGLAFASVRDIAAYLRQPHGDNPLSQGGATPPGRALLFGLSQSGRFIRDFLYQGFNEALSGAGLAGGAVFDAAVPLIAGSRKTHTNRAFSQAGRYQRQHEDHNYPGDQFPFAYRTLHDPISNLTDGVLTRCDAAGVTPKIMHLDTDAELWSARGSLVVTDCEGVDIEQPDNVRIYLAAGMPHGAAEPAAGATQLPLNDITYSALLRPLLVAMKDWVEKDVAPPPGSFPSIGAGTLVAPENAGFPDIPGVAYTGVVNTLHLADYAVIPPREGAAYPMFESTVDS